MAGINLLTDGTPLTFEWLNSLADAINQLSAQNADDSNVQFIGDVEGQDVLVVTGTQTVNIQKESAKGSQITVNNIQFKNAFKDSNVVVVAMVTSKASTGATPPKPAGITVTEITSTNFNAVVQLFDEQQKFGKIKFDIKYVAIGKKPTTL